MATVKIKQYHARQFGGAAGAYGNSTRLHFQLKTNATGAAIGADSSAALASGDVVDLGPLPAGMRLDDSLLIISAGMTATITGKLGFKYEDGADSAVVPQDDDYFGADLDLAAAARLRNATSNAPVVLPKPARLILTTAAAANAKASQLDIVISGELTGQ
ncbi:hypothetical protein SAMN05216229_102117 [Geopseudomonas sagittaria]|uniref:Uncharacterized protein n=1 Tax=Geopseudomonas sagittaria TaxID=1135990 RepID=A0A1I5Q0P6_9GAMM|nr:hypothetical protein [Pseudomonas sagittaria]SFP39416.1 hypothetical protein SAMN05216229_102117 [Pseudomonas sagittaria]